MIEGAPFPVIEEIYDPLSKRHNAITPQAPIIVIGYNLDMLAWENTNLYLISSVNDNKLIKCGEIHKFSNNKVYTIVPEIEDGEYFPALMILMKDKESFLYIFPISLVVGLSKLVRSDRYPYYKNSDK